MNNLCLESYYFIKESFSLKYEGNSAKFLFSLWLFYYPVTPGPWTHSTSGSTVGSADLKAWVTRLACGQVFLWIYFLIYVYFKVNIFLFSLIIKIFLLSYVSHMRAWSTWIWLCCPFSVGEACFCANQGYGLWLKFLFLPPLHTLISFLPFSFVQHLD